MVEAYVLIQVEVGKSAPVLEGVQKVKGVTEAVVVTGPYDIVAKAEAADLDALGKLVASPIQAVGGIVRTITCPVVRL